MYEAWVGPTDQERIDFRHESIRMHHPEPVRTIALHAAERILDAYNARKREYELGALNALKAGLTRSMETQERIPEHIAEEIAERPDDDEPWWGIYQGMGEE